MNSFIKLLGTYSYQVHDEYSFTVAITLLIYFVYIYQVKNLECELCSVKENYDALNEEYQSLLEQFKTIEKKKTNLEKLYIQVNNENGDLQDLKMRMEKELCELKNQNSLLKNKIMTATKGENGGNCDEIKNLRNKVRELAIKVGAT